MNSIAKGTTKRKGLAYATLNVDNDAGGDGPSDEGPRPSPRKKARKGGPLSILTNAADAYVPSSPPYAAFTQDAALSLQDYIEHPVRLGGSTYDEGQAKKRVWQLRCVESFVQNVRVLAVTGNTPLFALAKMIVEAFMVPKPAGKSYVPAMTKGWAPGDSYWSVTRNCERKPWMTSRDLPTEAAGLFGPTKGISKHVGRGAPHFHDWKKVKVYQLLRRRGDALTYHWPGSYMSFPISVRLDGIDCDSDRNGYVRTPRLVGATSMRKDDWTDVTADFIQNKPQEMMLVRAGLTEEEMNDAWANSYKVPKFDSRGDAIERKSYESLREMHDAVVEPFVECEVSSMTPYVPFK